MKRIYPILASFCLILFLLVLAAYLVLYVDTGFYAREFSQNGAAENSGMTLSQVLVIQDQLMDFLRGAKVDLSSIKANMNGQTVYFFNAKVIHHMEDVRFLFHTALKLGGISFLFLLAQVLHLKKLSTVQKKGYLAYLQKGCTLILALILVLVALIAAFFNKAFILFHEIFFSNDLWIFDYRTDYIIRWLPESFFQHVATEIIIVFILLLACCYIALKYYLYHLDKKENHNA